METPIPTGQPYIATRQYAIWKQDGDFIVRLHPPHNTQGILKKDGVNYVLFDPTGERQLAQMHGPLPSVFSQAAEALGHLTAGTTPGGDA